MHTKSELNKHFVKSKLLCTERLELVRALKDPVLAQSSWTLFIPFFTLGINLVLLDLI